MNNYYLWSFIVLVASILTNISLVNGEVVSSTSSRAAKTIPSSLISTTRTTTSKTISISTIKTSVTTSRTTTSKTIPSPTIREYTAVPFITYQTTKVPPATTTKALYNFSVENPPIVKSVKSVPFTKTAKTLNCLVNRENNRTEEPYLFKTTASTYYCKGIHKRTVSTTTGKTIPNKTSTRTGKTLPTTATNKTSTRTGKTLPTTTTNKTSTFTGKTIPSSSVILNTTRTTNNYKSITTTKVDYGCIEVRPVAMSILKQGKQIFTSKTISSTTTTDIPNMTTEIAETTETVETTETAETTVPNDTTVVITTTSTKKVLPSIVTVTKEITKEVTVTDKITVTNEITVTVSNCPCSATPSPTNSNCSKRYEQCGGKHYDGPTCCQSGKCQKVNEYYSQCI